jgi:hypothetical protein
VGWTEGAGEEVWLPLERRWRETEVRKRLLPEHAGERRRAGEGGALGEEGESARGRCVKEEDTEKGYEKRRTTFADRRIYTPRARVNATNDQRSDGPKNSADVDDCGRSFPSWFNNKECLLSVFLNYFLYSKNQTTVSLTDVIGSNMDGYH